MPSLLIEVRRQHVQEQEVAIMETVHLALREAFKIVPGDKNVRLIEHEPHRFACPPAREKPEFYTHISLTLLQAALWKQNVIYIRQL